MSNKPKGGGHGDKHVPDKGQAGTGKGGRPPREGGTSNPRPKDPRNK